MIIRMRARPARIEPSLGAGCNFIASHFFPPAPGEALSGLASRRRPHIGRPPARSRAERRSAHYHKSELAATRPEWLASLAIQPGEPLDIDLHIRPALVVKESRLGRPRASLGHHLAACGKLICSRSCFVFETRPVGGVAGFKRRRQPN